MSARARSGKGRLDTEQQPATPGKAGVRQSVENALLASPRKRNLVICLLLAAATFALYSPAIAHPFIFNYDDDNYVLNNSHVKAGLVWATVAWAWTSTEYSNWHPLTWLSHALDCQLYGLNPPGHHLTNILLHVLNVLLLFLLLARATGAPGRSLLVAALFAVHPFNVESVAWVAERKNVLSTFFFLLALGAYGWYALKPSLKRYGVVAILFVLGLASKPMVITLPCVLLLLDFWPLRRIKGRRHSSSQSLSAAKDQRGLRERLSPETAFLVPQAPFSRLVLEKLPLFALSAASGGVTIFAQRSYGAMHLALPLGVRLENAVYAYAMYVWKGFWPVQLAVFYPHPGATLAVWQLGLAALCVLSVSALVWRQRGARPYLVIGWLWFLGILVPVIGLIQVGEQAMADRYAYVPLIGIFLMAVWGAADVADRWQLSYRTRAKTAAIVLAIFTLFTCDQIRYWRSAYDLWSHTVDVTKDNFFAEENLGASLLVLDRSAEALPHLQNAIRIRPSDAAGHLNLAGVLTLSGRSRDAIVEYETAVPRISDPGMLVVAYETLGRLYGEVGNYSKARESYQQALRINPRQLTARDGLAQIEFSDALRSVSESPSAAGYLRLGQLFQQAGRASEAQAAYQQALELNPKFREAQKALDAVDGRNK
jgi:tetratricopeptide (TPR) repeat protein